MLQIEIAELIQKFAVKTVTNVRIAVKVKENVSKSLTKLVTGQPHYNAIFGVHETDRVISELCYNEVIYNRHIAK